MKILRIVVTLSLAFFVFATFVAAQKARSNSKPVTKPKSIIFAVIFGGETIEPIAYVEGGKLTQSPGGDEESQKLASFSQTYYNPKTAYNLIFGGGSDGRAVVEKSSIGECSGNSAKITSQPVKAKLSDYVMSLATNAPIKEKEAGLRRLPTAAERLEIENLVRKEFIKRKAPELIAKALNYHNLTAIDVDNDGNIELVGSYWIVPKPSDRNLLFFIAQRNKAGKLELGVSEYGAYTPKEIMSEDAKDLDEGVYHELLLDIYDYDRDGVSEIFTTSQAFEGRNFGVYRRAGGKWTKIFESYNYRCGY